MSVEQRRSERAIPLVSDEEMVVVRAHDNQALAKMLDLSEGGALVYLLIGSDVPFAVATECKLTLYHRGNTFCVASRVAHKTGRLIGFEFVDKTPDAQRLLEEKLIRLDVEWTRLRRRIDSNPHSFE